MSALRKAAQQALEQVQEFKRRWWLVPAFGNKVNKATREAITNAHSPIFELEHALRAALAEQQEPVAWMDRDGDVYRELPSPYWHPPHTPLYTAPQPRKRLTDEEIEAILYEGNRLNMVAFARAIERAHGIGEQE